MPEWWFEAALPSGVFGALFLLWVGIPKTEEEEDLGSRIRNFLVRHLRRKD